MVDFTKYNFGKEIYVLFQVRNPMHNSRKNCHTDFMKKKQRIASLLLYNFIGLTVAIGGWLWETLIFLVKEQRFVNRGFLYGPYLPVYGTGAVLLSILFYQKRITVMITYARLQTADYPQDFYSGSLYARLRQLVRQAGIRRRIPRFSIVSIYPQKKQPLPKKVRKLFADIRIFLLSMCGGCLTEFSTGWLLLHGFQRRCWDYSGYPLNLGGYICLFSALGFGIFGVLWMKWAGPFLICTWERLRFSIQILIIGLCDLIFLTDVIFSLLHPNEGESITFSMFLIS